MSGESIFNFFRHMIEFYVISAGNAWIIVRFCAHNGS